MKKLSDLFEESKELRPADSYDYVRRGLAEALMGSGVLIRSSPIAAPQQANRILIGFAPYSLHDLKLLDAVLEKVLNSKDRKEHIEVFDVLTCQNQEAFNQFIPGIGKVIETPVVGIWENTVLVDKASGTKARNLLIERYRLK